MERLKKFENFESINESRESMINVIRNILIEGYDMNNEASIKEVVNLFANKLFLNDSDKDAFISSIIGD